MVKSRSLCLLTLAAALTEAHPHHVEDAQSSVKGIKRAIDTSSTPRPKFGSVPYGVSITHCTTPGKVALTFDDGPCEYTSRVLDILDKNNAKATFFLVGTNGGEGMVNAAYRPVMKRMVASGHQVASHSWSHKNMNEISHEERMEEILKNEDIFVEILGFIPTYFRPPYTECNGDCYGDWGAMGYHVTDYDLDTKDWENGGAAAKDIYSGAIQGADSGSQSFIALAHDIQDFTVNGFVQYMVDMAQDKGFEMTTLGDCLGDAPENWYRDPKTGDRYNAAPPPPPAPTTTSKPPPPPTTTSVKPTTTSTTSTTSIKPPTSTTKPSSTKATTTTSSASKSPSASASSTDNDTSETVVPSTTPTQTPTPSESTPATVSSGSAAVAPVGVAANSLLASLFGAVAWIMIL